MVIYFVSDNIYHEDNLDDEMLTCFALIDTTQSLHFTEKDAIEEFNKLKLVTRRTLKIIKVEINSKIVKVS